MFLPLPQPCRYPKDRKLIVSVHDLTPRTKTVFFRFLQQLSAIGVPKTSLLVVPFWHNTHSSIAHDKEFIAWLHSMAVKGHEICLHGFSHSSDGRAQSSSPISWFIANIYTRQEGEFFTVDTQEANRKLARGLECLRSIQAPVYGFVPPAWLLSREGLRAVAQAGFHYTTTLNYIHLLHEKRRFYAPTLVCTCRTSWRRIISQAWIPLWSALNRTTRLLRIAVHPIDLQFPTISRMLFSVIRKTLVYRTSITYRDLFVQDSPLPEQII